MKFRKHQTFAIAFLFLCLLIAGIVQWTEISVPLAHFLAANPVTNFIEVHIVHKKFNPETIIKNWTNVIKGISGTFILFAVVLLFIMRKKFLPRLKSVYAVLSALFDGAVRTINSLLSKQAALFFVCGCFGALFFILTFGASILDVTYTDYLMSGGDLSQHYTGWLMFRNSAWHFPPGLMDNIIYPFKESIIYTDSIPLFALFFKAVSPVLPQNFQYFGIFGLTVYFLQGALAALVLRKICKNSFYPAAGSVFFIFSTTMMQRIYAHTSLSAHFIILLCIYACMPAVKRSPRSNIFVWSGLFALSASIHIYFIPVVFIFMIAALAKDFWEDRLIRDKIITAVVSTACGIAVMFALGAFYSGANAAAGLLGESSMNLNALFNPVFSTVSGYMQDLSIARFLKPLPFGTQFQYEGFGYLGFGVLLGCLLVFAHLIKSGRGLKNVFQNMEYKRNAVLIFAVFLFFLVFALSPVITFNSKILFRYYIPGVNYVLSIFRSTGRYVWILMYIIMFVMIWAIKKIFGAKKGFLLLCALLTIQYIDLKDYFSGKGYSFKSKARWETPLVSPEWSALAENKKHIVFLQRDVNLYPFLDFAARYALTVNDAYLARKNEKQIEQFKNKEKERIHAGGADKNTIYVFETEDEAEKYREMLDISVIDGIIAGVKKTK